MKPRVSIIIPFRDRTESVGKAVRSVLEQTYTDFEVILVDDGSTEDVTRYVAIPSARVRYVRQENTGVSAARNLGIGLAEGRYVAFLDSDDLFASNKLERQVSIMERNPDLLLSHTSYQYFDSNGRFLNVVRSGRFGGWVYPRIVFNCQIATSTVMVRKDAFTADLKFDQSIRVAEDVLVWSQLARISRIAGIDEVLSFVRRHPGAAAFDVEAQLTGIHNVVRYFLTREKTGGLMWRRLVSSYHVFRSGVFYTSARSREARIESIYAIIRCPLNLSGYLYLILSFFPVRVGRVLVRARRSVGNWMTRLLVMLSVPS